MDYKGVAERLHELERKVLLALKAKDSQFSEGLIKTAELDEASVNRALLWLSSKKLIEVKADVKELVSLDINGQVYVTEGLPEKRFLGLINKGVNTLSDLRGQLNKDEFNVSIGLLKSNDYISVGKGVVKVTKAGSKWLKKESDAERLLKRVGEAGDISGYQKIINKLSARKRVIKVELKTIRTAKLTNEGKRLLRFVKIESLIGQLTPKLLVSGAWRDGSFRKYDLKAPSPRVFHGKKGLPSYMKSKFRQIFLDMGFTEMQGNFMESSFWNFDALYTPQDHPAREMQDTFFIKKPSASPLPSKELVRRIARVHTNGGDTGSRGWGYDWSEDVASTNVLRTHTTGVSARTLAGLTAKDLPAKFFSLGTVFRNETLDYKHLFQFHQIEGIVVDPKATFRDLLGMLRLFFNRLGFERARFRPGYYPYTEMSVEPEVFHPIKKDWMALGGAGMFRPEVVKPLMGVDVPVLAWGLSFERPIMDMFDIKDMRDIYSDDINVLREMSGLTRRF